MKQKPIAISVIAAVGVAGILTLRTGSDLINQAGIR